MESIDLTFNEEIIKKKLFTLDSPSRTVLKDSFFTPSAVLFTIIPHENNPYELVLIHRADTGLKHSGEMSFPGGKMEPRDKSLEDTALRECEEEIGVSRSAIILLGCLHDFPTLTKYIITPVVGYFSKDQELIRDEREVQEIIKVPIDFFLNKKSFREEIIDFQGKKFPVFYFKYKANNKKYTIWGATAHLITTFIQVVYDKNLSNINLQRFTMKEIKPLKNYIEMRHKMVNEKK